MTAHHYGGGRAAGDSDLYDGLRWTSVKYLGRAAALADHCCVFEVVPLSFS